MENKLFPTGLFHHADHLYHLAPIPLIMYEVPLEEQKAWHQQILKDARAAYTQDILEVPDVRHIDNLGTPPNFLEDTWVEEQKTAVGVWHRVPTNQCLSINTPAIYRLRTLIEEHYKQGLQTYGLPKPEKAYISESWIQFYQNGDYKVLHNHERYGPPYPDNNWAGAYYIRDGEPDKNMPYSGMFSFRIRHQNHFIRPRAGLLLIWPADILHEVHPFYGASERIVINFNINSSPITWL